MARTKDSIRLEAASIRSLMDQIEDIGGAFSHMQKRFGRASQDGIYQAAQNEVTGLQDTLMEMFNDAGRAGEEIGIAQEDL